jgi:hypothetical protein
MRASTTTRPNVPQQRVQPMKHNHHHPVHHENNDDGNNQTMINVRNNGRGDGISDNDNNLDRPQHPIIHQVTYLVIERDHLRNELKGMKRREEKYIMEIRNLSAALEDEIIEHEHDHEENKKQLLLMMFLAMRR